MDALDNNGASPDAATVRAFAAWLTTRPGVISVGSREHPEPIASACETFIAEHVVPAPSDEIYAAACRIVDETYGPIRAEHARLVRQLDVALNGAVGAAPQASLCDLVAQVERQRCVQVLNLPDGMRINFQAPDGRRATLHVGVPLDCADVGARVGFMPGMTAIMRETIAAYPVAGLARSSVVDECGANMNGHRFGPNGPAGEHQCEWCGEVPK